MSATTKRGVVYFLQYRSDKRISRHVVEWPRLVNDGKGNGVRPTHSIHYPRGKRRIAGRVGYKHLLARGHRKPVRENQRSMLNDELIRCVTIGEGRRLAQLFRVKRKEIKKTEPIRCIVDTANDPHEISLDENVTRENMHPADQFEAFKKLADERGFGAEDIAARFGVTPHVVRQRLRLGSVSPKLMQVYRDGGLTLEQLMAFAITGDHARQEAVYERLSHNRDASSIRRLLTETHVAATDRRAVFVGAEAYTEAGGTILRDLFTEDRGGYFEDVALPVPMIIMMVVVRSRQ